MLDTPTLLRAGTPHSIPPSSYGVTMADDSLEGIFETVKTCALIGRQAVPLGLAISNIRAEGTTILGTGGLSSGVVPMLRVFDECVRSMATPLSTCSSERAGKEGQGGYMRVYLEAWHADLPSFLELRKLHGKEERRARHVH